MTSKQFYQILDAGLFPECQRLGFCRCKGAASRWKLGVAAGELFFEVGKGPKGAYIQYLGGRFYVHWSFAPKNGRPDPNPFGGFSYMKYLSDTDLLALQRQRDEVSKKICAQTPEGEFDRMMLDLARPITQLEIGTTFRRHQVTKLNYLDVNDVAAWSKLLASFLEKTLAGAKEELERSGTIDFAGKVSNGSAESAHSEKAAA